MVYGVWCMVGVGCRVGVWWITTVVIIRPSQPSLAGVGAGAELGKNICNLFKIQINKIFEATQLLKNSVAFEGGV